MPSVANTNDSVNRSVALPLHQPSLLLCHAEQTRRHKLFRADRAGRHVSNYPFRRRVCDISQGSALMTWNRTYMHVVVYVSHVRMFVLFPASRQTSCFWTTPQAAADLRNVFFQDVHHGNVAKRSSQACVFFSAFESHVLFPFDVIIIFFGCYWVYVRRQFAGALFGDLSGWKRTRAKSFRGSVCSLTNERKQGPLWLHTQGAFSSFFLTEPEKEFKYRVADSCWKVSSVI